MFGNIWADIQNYFRDWLKETGGIGAYSLFNIDLSEARDNKRYTFTGDQVIITDCDNAAYLTLNDIRNDPIDLTLVREIHTPFNEFYITNAASSGSLKILVGSEGIFNCNQTQPIDITRCNIGNLPIDINASTIGNLPIDIKANTLGNLDVNLAANAIGNLPIDIKAATLGNLAIDLNAQSIGNLDIDLNAQSINRLVIQDNDGGIESSGSTGTNCLKDSETTIHSYSGSGSFRYAIFSTSGAQAGIGTSLAPRIYIDGTVMNPIFTFGTYSVQGFNSNSAPRQLLAYNVDEICTLLIYFTKGIVFDSSLSIRVNNHSVPNDYTINTSWFYQALT